MNLESAERNLIPAPLQDKRFDPVSVLLHWLTVLLIIGQFTTAWLHEAAGHGTSLGAEILDAHRTMGVMTWTVALARVVWRQRFAYLPPFPESMPKLQRWIAKANEYGLYTLLLVQPVTGLAAMVVEGRPFALFLWQVPTLMTPDPAIHLLLERAHKVGGNALLVLIGLHACAALFHGLVLRDGVLQRMLRWPLAQS
jgi:cytochrome b561